MAQLALFPTRPLFFESIWILSRLEQVLASFGSVGRNFFNVNPKMELGNQHGEDNMFFIKWQNYSESAASITPAVPTNEVNGNETACISLLNCENEFWTPESFPCLHDEVLAAAVDATTSLSSDQKERQGASGIFVNISKNFKAGKADQNANPAVHTNRLENLKQLFSSPPFLKSSSNTVDNQDPFALDIDDIQIDELVLFSSPQKIDIDKRGRLADKGKGTDRPKLFEVKGKATDRPKLFEDKGKATDRQKLFDSTSDSKPRARTTEEIKAKYRKTGMGDASAAAALARNKLVERQEKLQLLNERTEELQNGAQDFASMATELAKRMENRKWWQL
ncbi:unnamed protein product [Sphenostylis stenocarpa]|uniref:V-SNARE coiled-coil homology domain-containing protein n=1 Tax=Sphenostylis stenocarpa TaxID=92480 RepID=A0AA86T7N8_9FABA|nr:unnamed protein product [Sphenostylis stenocarpa]